jgi:5-methylcytosine-specific restriction protein A
MKLTTLRPRIAMLGPDPRIGNADRPNARGRGYTSKWDAAAAKFKRAYPRCLGCAAVGREVATEVVDHVVPHRGDAELFWNVEQWQPACRWHHDVVKKRLEAMFDQNTITAAALWLDSAMAVAISKRELDMGRGLFP